MQVEVHGGYVKQNYDAPFEVLISEYRSSQIAVRSHKPTLLYNARATKDGAGVSILEVPEFTVVKFTLEHDQT